MSVRYFKSYEIYKGQEKVVELDTVKQVESVMWHFLGIDHATTNSMIAQSKDYKGYGIVVRRETKNERRIRKATEKSLEKRG